MQAGQGENDGRVLAEVFEHSGTGHAARLAELIASALAQAKVELAAVDALAVSIGPGSFTGLRVGLSFAKGVAFASGAPLVGVGTLEALAAAAPPRFSVVAAVTDARRGETYSAIFRRTAGSVERLVEDAALTPPQAAQRIVGELGGASSCALVGDGAERYGEAFARLRDLAVEIIPFREIHPRGSVVASLGERRLRRGESDRPETLVPLYVRASAAERNLGVSSLTRENPVS
jgi:tRNA threonylcarbamoyladenosine biosynthesis protein TsaB